MTKSINFNISQYDQLSSDIKKLECKSLIYAVQILYHLSQTDSINFHADSQSGFLKNDQQEFHLGCLYSLKYKLSTLEEYFSKSFVKSNLQHNNIKFLSFFNIEDLYQKFILILSNSIVLSVFKLKNFQEMNIFEVSRPKHQAFQYTAHHTDQGNQINLCKNVFQ